MADLTEQAQGQGPGPALAVVLDPDRFESVLADLASAGIEAAVSTIVPDGGQPARMVVLPAGAPVPRALAAVGIDPGGSQAYIVEGPGDPLGPPGPPPAPPLKPVLDPAKAPPEAGHWRRFERRRRDGSVARGRR